jgi:Methyltransferase domain
MMAYERCSPQQPHSSRDRLEKSQRASAPLSERRFQRLIDIPQGLVEQLDNDTSLLEPDRLRERLEGLDLLDAYFPDTHHPVSDAEPNAAGLHRRARAVYARLEAVNFELYQSIRNEIQRGDRPDTLLWWARSSAEIEDVAGPVNGIGYDYYDYLDELISGVFQFEEPSAGPVQREAERVAYQPTPTRHIFSLIGLTALTEADVLIDVGSGLGHVPLLVSICTGARSIGIELEAAYVERARQCAQRLNLDGVTFIRQDARAADFTVGTVFYLYTPFTGSILSDVLNHLRCEAAQRQIRICTYGPCASAVAEEPWLEAAAAPDTHRITLFRSS